MSEHTSTQTGAPAKHDKAAKERPANEGESAATPAEGGDDAPAPLPGSARG